MTKSSNDTRFESSYSAAGVPEQVETFDIRFLISTLLVYVAKSDGEISEYESNRMIDLLATQMKISRPEALERLRTAIMVLADDANIFTRLQEISRGLSDEQRFEILWLLMDVMVIDRDQQTSEQNAITLAGQILGLSLDTIHAQLRSISRRA